MSCITQYPEFEDTLRDEISPEGDTRICIVWDVQEVEDAIETGTSIPEMMSKKLKPSPADLIEKFAAGKVGVIATPAPQMVFPILMAFDRISLSFEYVVGIIKLPEDDFTDLAAELADNNNLLVAYSGDEYGAKNYGQYAELFEFLEKEKDYGTYRQVAYLGCNTFEREAEELRLFENEKALFSMIHEASVSMGYSYGFEPDDITYTHEQLDEIARILSNGKEIDLPDSLPPRWKYVALSAVQEAVDSACAFADIIPQTGLEAIAVLKNRNEDLARYRLLWECMFEEVGNGYESGNKSKKPTAQQVIDFLKTIANGPNMPNMMEAVDLGVPPEYIVADLPTADVYTSLTQSDIAHLAQSLEIAISNLKYN